MTVTDSEAPDALRVLGRSECRRLLAEQRVGRVAVIRQVAGPAGAQPVPVVIPVNYALDGDSVVFRTGGSTLLVSAAARHPTAAFEVDDLEPATATGWSVLLTGTLSEITEPDDLRRAAALGVVAWAGGVRDHYLRFEPTYWSGRRISPTGCGRPGELNEEGQREPGMDG